MSLIKKTNLSKISEVIARKFPNLKLDLIQAIIKYPPRQYIEKTLTSTLILTIGLDLPIFLIFSKLKGMLFASILFLLLLPVIAFISFFFFMQLPKSKARKISKQADQEIVNAGRFLLVELTAGVPLFNAIANTAKNYTKIGVYLNTIVRQVEVGTPMDKALSNVIEITPSENLRKLLWQILNSMKTGADVSQSVSSILDQIYREQMIEVKEYSRKLNPLVMFYLIIAIIFPSLGITMMVLLSSFVSFKITPAVLGLIIVIVTLAQFMFFSIIKSSRPGVEI